jgi:choline dehydrogenase-like flavoprotein
MYQAQEARDQFGSDYPMKLDYKAIVIGSGAGGAPAAASLAARFNDGVAILEAGKHYSAADFNQIERDLLPKLYAAGGLQATEDGSISVLQGSLVGGSTVNNDALCFLPPEEIADRWKPYGVTLDMKELRAFADQVQTAMGVEPIAKEQINRSNYLLGLGASRLGWKGERLSHNSPGCVQCGFRHFGCAYERKQSMNLTYVPQAVRLGAALLPETRVTHLSRRGGLWHVHTNRGEFTAEVVVLAAGIVHTPLILQRSGIPAGEGLQFHLQTLVWGDFEEPVDGFNGIPMSYGVMEFADIYGHRGPGYLIEGVNTQPMSFSGQPQMEGIEHEEILRRYRHLAGCVMLLRSTGRGKVEPGPGGRPKITYPLVSGDTGRISHFYQKASELYLAAGAKRVLLSHRKTRWLTRPSGDLEIGPGMQYMYTAHPFGGANRGTVTDGEGRVKGADNLWVLDASAFPEALGVNPQITIASLALQGAQRIAVR